VKKALPPDSHEGLVGVTIRASVRPDRAYAKCFRVDRAFEAIALAFIVSACGNAASSSVGPSDDRAAPDSPPDDGGSTSEAGVDAAATDDGAPSDAGAIDSGAPSDAASSDGGTLPAGQIQWAGLRWQARAGAGGPGPNRWDSRNVFVDGAGNLHLQIANRDGQWTCAEVTSTQSLGFGRYQWYVEGALDQLDPNVVLGLFTYPPASVGPDGTNEIDVEISRWGNAALNPLNYTVWPASPGLANATTSWPMVLSGTYTTHRFDCELGQIAFQSVHGFEAPDAGYPIAQWVYAPSSDAIDRVPHTAVPSHLNLWLFQGHPPASGAGVEIVIHDFEHP